MTRREKALAQYKDKFAKLEGEFRRCQSLSIVTDNLITSIELFEKLMRFRGMEECVGPKLYTLGIELYTTVSAYLDNLVELRSKAAHN